MRFPARGAVRNRGANTAFERARAKARRKHTQLHVFARGVRTDGEQHAPIYPCAARKRVCIYRFKRRFRKGKLQHVAEARVCTNGDNEELVVCRFRFLCFI